MSDRPSAILPVVEEKLEVGRRTIDTGRTVRLHKEVREEPVEVTHRLQDVDVEVKRVPLGRIVQEAPGVRHAGDVTIVPVLEERLVTRKELVLVEEVHIRRRTSAREVREQVNLRRESVRVERFDPATQQWLPEDGS